MPCSRANTFTKDPIAPSWVIKTETQGGIWPECLPKPEELDLDDWQGIRDFVKENQAAKLLRSSIYLERSGRGCVAGQNQQDSLDDETAWKLFHETYPDSPGTLAFSTVGFNEATGSSIGSEPRN